MIAVTETGTQKELLRQKSIADLVTAHKIAHPEIEHNLRMSLERLKKSRSLDETAYLRAQTKYAAGAGRLSEQKADRIDRLLGEEEEALRTGNELRAKQIEEFLDIEISGEEGVARARDVFGLLGKKLPSTLPREKFTAAQEKEMSVIESEIVAEPESAKALGHYERFNKRSNRPYVFVPVKTKPWIGKPKRRLKKISLPKIVLPAGEERMLTAREVTRAAKNAQMSLEDYLRIRLGVVW